MKFLIVSHVLHKQIGQQLFSYGPYVKEMNLWLNYVDELIIVAPVVHIAGPDPIDLPYSHKKIKMLEVPEFNLLSWRNRFQTLLTITWIFYRVLSQMAIADHIHLRCPGNMGLIGCATQILFPLKKKIREVCGKLGSGKSTTQKLSASAKDAIQ